MGLVDLSYGPFGHPPYGPCGHPPFGPFGHHPNGLRNLGRTPSQGELLLLAVGQHAQLGGPNRRLCAVRDTKLGDGVAQVLLDGAHADEEGAGYLMVGVTSRYQP